MGSVRQAIQDVEAKIGNFRDVFGQLEFRLFAVSPGTNAAETREATLVDWYNDRFEDALLGGQSKSQNRTFNIVHELGHVVAFHFT